MTKNGSPAAVFEFDEERSYFMVRLPVHPAALEVESQIGTKSGPGGDQITPKVTPKVTPEVRLAKVLKGAMSRRELQQALQLKDDEHFRKVYLLAALDQGLIEMAIPDKPRSSKQRYRLTDKGRQVLEKLEGAE
jgi:ATP-dependent DNA helicase RecG